MNKSFFDQTIKESFTSELKWEAEVTQRLLVRLPESDFDWKPHEKSMSLFRLASHLVEIISWISTAITFDELDFSKQSSPFKEIKTTPRLVELYKKEVSVTLNKLENADIKKLKKNFTLRNGSRIYLMMPKDKFIRQMGLNHFVHHRGQLSVYVLLRNIPIPPIYFFLNDAKLFEV